MRIKECSLVGNHSDYQRKEISVGRDLLACRYAGCDWGTDKSRTLQASFLEEMMPEKYLEKRNGHSMGEMQIIGGDDLSSLAGKEFICTQPLCSAPTVSSPHHYCHPLLVWTQLQTQAVAEDVVGTGRTMEVEVLRSNKYKPNMIKAARCWF
ncbi:Phosphoribosyltransferase domain-containing protein 1 [Manis javanica]|nr:Phosphoribosyltransferase domain-containing protein 1 [Manis javanica]